MKNNRYMNIFKFFLWILIFTIINMLFEFAMQVKSFYLSIMIKLIAGVLIYMMFNSWFYEHFDINKEDNTNIKNTKRFQFNDCSPISPKGSRRESEIEKIMKKKEEEKKRIEREEQFKRDLKGINNK